MSSIDAFASEWAESTGIACCKPYPAWAIFWSHYFSRDWQSEPFPFATTAGQLRGFGSGRARQRRQDLLRALPPELESLFALGFCSSGQSHCYLSEAESLGAAPRDALISQVAR